MPTNMQPWVVLQRSADIDRMAIKLVNNTAASQSDLSRSSEHSISAAPSDESSTMSQLPTLEELTGGPADENEPGLQYLLENLDEIYFEDSSVANQNLKILEGMCLEAELPEDVYVQQPNQNFERSPNAEFIQVNSGSSDKEENSTIGTKQQCLPAELFSASEKHATEKVPVCEEIVNEMKSSQELEFLEESKENRAHNDSGSNKKCTDIVDLVTASDDSVPKITKPDLMLDQEVRFDATHQEGNGKVPATKEKSSGEEFKYQDTSEDDDDVIQLDVSEYDELF